jgi:hypothetical protein
VFLPQIHDSQTEDDQGWQKSAHAFFGATGEPSS